MTALLLTVLAAVGVYLVVIPSRRTRAASSSQWTRLRRRAAAYALDRGITPPDYRPLGTRTAAAAGIGTIVGWLIFGGLVAPGALALFAGTFPVAAHATRAARRRSVAADAWPQLIEEIRLLCGSLGRPIPQALVEVGRNAPAAMQPAFAAATREWRISTDFERMVTVLKEQLADPTADAACETLLVAHQLGGADIDRRLAALARDRQQDLDGRRDARAKQAGVRFARRFVLIVPVGMALAGLSIGNGRAAYGSVSGQIAVAVAVITLAACWFWAGRLIRLPQEERVLRG